MKVSLSRRSASKDCTKTYFSRKGCVDLFLAFLETHITYFIWVQHILPSHSISGWICNSLFSFFPTSKYVQNWTWSEHSNQPCLRNDGKWRFLGNPSVSKIVQRQELIEEMLDKEIERKLRTTTTTKKTFKKWLIHEIRPYLPVTDNAYFFAHLSQPQLEYIPLRFFWLW